MNMIKHGDSFKDLDTIEEIAYGKEKVGYSGIHLYHPNAIYRYTKSSLEEVDGSGWNGIRNVYINLNDFSDSSVKMVIELNGNTYGIIEHFHEGVWLHKVFLLDDEERIVLNEYKQP